MQSGVFTPTLLLLIVQLKTSIVQTRNIYSFLVLYLYTHYYVLLCMYYDDLIKVNAPIKIIALQCIFSIFILTIVIVINKSTALITTTIVIVQYYYIKRFLLYIIHIIYSIYILTTLPPLPSLIPFLFPFSLSPCLMCPSYMHAYLCTFTYVYLVIVILVLCGYFVIIRC